MKLKSHLRKLGKIPVIGPVLMGIFRFAIGLRRVLPRFIQLLRWVFRSNEYTNFTYELTELNKAYLAAFVAAVTGASRKIAMMYIRELENDERLRTHVEELTQKSSERHFSDPEARYHKRLGWYVIARITKPEVVVETGVEKGLGSCVIAAALLKNEEEGHDGYYYGTDIQSRAGFLFQEPYARMGEILYGDSIESLKELETNIDLFINDSDHSRNYERREYQTIQDKLSDTAIVIGDNSHETSELLDFARETGRSFLYWGEEPRDHWYPGGGIGAAYNSV